MVQHRGLWLTCGPCGPAEDRLHSAGLSGSSSVPRGQDQTRPEFCVPHPCSFMVNGFSLGVEDLAIAGKQHLRPKTTPHFLRLFCSLLPVYSLLGSPRSLHQSFRSWDQIHSFGSNDILINFDALANHKPSSSRRPFGPTQTSGFPAKGSYVRVPVTRHRLG